MKRLVITLLGVGIVGGAFALLNVDSSLEVMNPRIEHVEVEVDALEVRIKEAQDQALSEIETKANDMRNKFIENELKTIEAQVLKDVEAEIKARRTDVEKETGAY